MLSLTQKSTDAVSTNVAMTAFQTAIRQQVELREAVEEAKEREREAEAQRQREEEDRLSKIAEGASISDSSDSTNANFDTTSSAPDERGGRINLNV